MKGIRLPSMDCGEMMDILHYLFEEDLHVSTTEEVQSISKTRKLIYEDLYGREYKYAVTVDAPSSRQSSNDTYPSDGYEEMSDLVPFDPEQPIKYTHKKYVPATDFNENSVQPFGLVLDAPLS